MGNTKVKNIVISGTNMWNPGDDFVRDGVIRILQKMFEGFQLNFIFYNFNQDFFPQSKFTGIANMLSKGDLEECSDLIDAVVIAGLSAGTEIKDLYNWILQNQLEDRVYLIGAGYENSYVERYISEEPESSIFRSARIIVGRTRKKPQFISKLNLPYHHINCPALLSVSSVKDVPPNKKILRIAVSIQLPHNKGVPNHCCSQAMHDLGIKILLSLKANYHVEVIAHHKSEYFHFVNLLKGKDIPVIFSSFYHDLFDIYPRYDLVVTTRLHASLFGNGFGIPGIIINDTDRHTDCLEGFPHSVWVNSIQSFNKELQKITCTDLRQIALEADSFKKNLMNKYLEILREPFGVPSTTKGFCLEKPEMATLLADIGSVEVKQRVLANLLRLSADAYLNRNIDVYRNAIEKGATWFDSLIFLHWYATNFRPTTYLEVGVRRGRSMAQVLVASPETCCYGFDLWISNYAGVDNPGPEVVMSELRQLNSQNSPMFIKGDSHKRLQEFWSNPANPQLIDLIFIDGEHAYEGAKIDLDDAFGHLAPGGALLFDGICHSSHSKLYTVWQEYKARFTDFLFIEDFSGNGTACVFKPPFEQLERHVNNLISSINHQDSVQLPKVVNKSNILLQNIPVHFFSIVLNGEPFIRKHIEVFKGLPFKWHWHIVEGVADLKHDTGWSLKFGGKITDELHRNGLSNDGTTQYLNELAEQFPENITIYRKPSGRFWDGKLEMVNAPIENIREECLLWQVDSDEVWTADQIQRAHRLFSENPDQTAAFYLCNFFVGPDLIITTKNTYGNHTDYEWIRTWRYKPGDRWATHEPPRLCRKDSSGKWVDLAQIEPILHLETESNGLVFNHYAYVTLQQLRFKEVYYGHSNAVELWNSLQSADEFPVLLKDYFPWVKDGALVDRVSPDEGFVRDFTNFLWIRGDSIGDNVLAASMLPYVKEKYPNANITVVCQDHIVDLYESSPFVSDVIGFDRLKGCQDEAYRNLTAQRLQAVRADVVLNSLYSRDPLYDFLAINSGARTSIAFNGNLCNISADVRDRNNGHYTNVIKDREKHKPELERHRDFLSEIGIDAPSLQPIVWITPDDEKYADTFFSHYQLDTENTIALFVCGQWAGKFYDHYDSVLSRILKDSDMNVLTLGSDSDRKTNARIIKNLGVHAVNLAGKTTLRQTAAILKRCSLGIGADTGSAHIACAVGTPNVVLLGGGHFGRFMPYSPLTAVVCLPLECYGCNWHCKYERVHCVKDIQPEVFETAIRETLERTCETPRVFVQASSLWNPSDGMPQWKSFEKFLDPRNVEIKLIEDDVPLLKAGGFCRQQEREVRTRKSILGSRKSEIRGRESDSDDGRKMGSPEKLYETALGFLKSGREKETIGALNLLLSLYPNFALAHNDLGVLYYRNGDKENSLQHYEKAAELQPENITFLKNLADFYCVETKDLEKALRVYLKVLVAKPKDVETFLILGDICVSLEKDSDAGVFYGRVLELDPLNPVARERLAALRRRVGSDVGSQMSDSTKPMPEICNREEQKNRSKGLSLSDGHTGKYLVSAIVSAYNSERFIRGCLEDLESQTISDKLEIIVVNSASEQNDEAIVKEFQSRYPNIKYLKTEQRETVYAAWNRGIKAASGRYVTNANTDDRHVSYAFERMVHVLDKNPDISLVYADVWITEKENETFENFTPSSWFRWKDFDPKTLIEGCYIGPQPMWRKDVHEEYGYFDEAFHSAGDWEFWLRISKTKKLFHLKEFLGLYLKSPTSAEHRDLELSRAEVRRIRQLYASWNNENVTGVERMHRNAQILINTGRKKEAKAALLELINAHPNFAIAHNDLGVLYLDENDKDNALKRYQKAVELAPENSIFAKNLADFYFIKLGRAESALEIYVRLLTKNPKDVEVLTALGYISMSLGQYDNARIFFCRILETDPLNHEVQGILNELTESDEMEESERKRQVRAWIRPKKFIGMH